MGKVAFHRIALAVLLGIGLCAHDIHAQDSTGGRPAASTIPGGQTAESGAGIAAEDVFGREGGYLHPFLFLEGMYTDNLYYTNSGDEEDFITTVAPGLWLAVPANREQLLEIDTSPTSTGGLQVSRMKPQGDRRMQSYLMYSPSFVSYSQNSRHDHVNHRAEGLFMYNFDMGLSVDVMDQFNNRHEINNNAAERLDEYHDNIANLLLTYQTSKKFKFRLDFGNYVLDYDEAQNDFRDRMDNSVAAYVFYQILPKTSVFGEYEYADIDYDERDLFNSEEHRYYLGVDWDITADSRGRIKAGYMKKIFDESRFGEDDGFSAEVQIFHSFNPKRHASLIAYRRFTESSMSTAYEVITTGINFSLMQRFTAKWSSTLNLMYYEDDYEATNATSTTERKDDTFRIGPALIFEPRDWMKVILSYYYSTRDSEYDVYEFENNTIALSIDLAL